MRKLLLGIVGLAVVGALVAYAEEKVEVKTAAPASGDVKACSAVWAKLNLTADQKAKVAECQGGCLKGGCTKESQETCMKGLEGVLNADQMKELKAACEKNGGKCPRMPVEKKTEEVK